MLTLFSQEETNNYKLYFPLAFAGLFTGTGLWIFGQDDTYRRVWHPLLMTYSFLFPVVLGFLWSGIPRFIATEFPGPLIKSFYLLIILLSWVFVILDQTVYFKFLMVLSFAGLLAWYFRAWQKRKTTPVLVVVFLFYALLSAFAGSAIMLAADFADLPPVVVETGVNLYRFVFVILLTGSVGSRMIPVMGKKKPPEKNAFYIWNLSFAYKPWFWFAAGFVIVAVLAVPGFYILKFAVLLFIIRDIWLVFRPSAGTSQAFRFITAVLMMAMIAPLLHYLPALSPASASHFLFLTVHLTFVMIVMARVVLAHGGHGLEKENRSLLFAIAYTIMIVAAFLRTFTGSNPEHLRYISLLLVSGVVVWIIEMGRGIYSSGSKP